jgi:hypothetical protein
MLDNLGNEQPRAESTTVKVNFLTEMYLGQFGKKNIKLLKK